MERSSSRRRRLGILALTFACLAMASGAEARDGWLGVQLAFPVPARDIGDTQLGIDVGVTFNQMQNPYVGFGLDVAYHYWPASPDYKAAFDRYLRNTRFEVIDASTWAFSALQVTTHLRVWAPMLAPRGPWVQVGGGMYRVNRNLAGSNRDGVYAYVIGGPSNIQVVPGGYASVGYDFPVGSRWLVGFDANCHHVWSEHEGMRNFTAFTAGTHILFGKSGRAYSHP